MLSPALPPVLPGSMTDNDLEPSRPGAAAERSPLVSLVGFKKLPHFSEEFLGSSGQVKRIKYLEIPRTERMRPIPPTIVVQPPGSLGSSSMGCPGVTITDTSRRKDKLRAFANQCSWATEHVYFGGEAVARNWNTLKSKGITHVVNCVRLELDNYFQQHLTYMELFLQDSGAEDMLCVLYDAFDFIEDARRQNGRVFVHCSQGVSRSAALVIAYDMWLTGRSFDIVKAEMKEKRGVVDPNANFSLQLMFWDKRRKDPHDCTIYRMSPQSRNKPGYLVPKLCFPPTCMTGGKTRTDALDPRGAFIVKLEKKAILWVGRYCPKVFVDSGRRFLGQLRKYEKISSLQEIQEGQETDELKQAMGLDLDILHEEFVAERDAFSPDFALFHNSMTPRASVTEGIRPSYQPPVMPGRPPIPSFRRCQSEPTQD